MTCTLAVRTPWSFHHGASSVEDLASRAAELGLSALGMADLGGLWGAVPFQKACQAQGVRPLFGVQLGPAHLLALDEAGWGALCRLSTQWMVTPEVERPWGLAARISAEGAGFAVLSGDAGFLRELQLHGGEAASFATHPATAEATGLPQVLAEPVVAARREDWPRHRLLTAIGRNTNLPALRPQDLAPQDAFLGAVVHGGGGQSAAEEKAIQCNTQALVERAEFCIELGRKRMPRFPVPGGRSAAAQLARLCERGWKRRRLSRKKTESYRIQLRRELALIEVQDFSDYFLVVADLVQWARQRGIHACGRGSAANSLVSWLLGFTHVDPIAHGLYFDRFMNTGREDFPDVDLDFAWDERDTVLAHAFERWGRDRLALIATHNTFAARGAVRELAKVMGLPPAEIGVVTRALPWHGGGSLDAEALRRNPKTRGLPLDAEPWHTILQQAAALDGFPRHVGVHPGGTVLSPGPLTDFLPLQHSKKETEQGPLRITQWDMYAVEDAGLVKIDLLGNRGLAVVRDAAAQVRQNSGLLVDFGRIVPERDTATCKLIQRGDTMGCFYIESPGMRGLLRKLQCGDFSTLVAASSIIRPGISQSGMMRAYIDRHHAVRVGRSKPEGARGEDGHDPAWYLHPKMRELLSETYGVMTYQEDVMKVSEVLAGFSAADADQLRRSMSRKRAFRRFEFWQEKFLAGAKASGMEDALAEELWRQIESFSGYSFCKAHSASYATVSFRSAWLRAHFPAEFMAAVLRNHGGFYSTFAYVEEARRMGLALDLPCVNEAEAGFSGGGGRVRAGLAEIESFPVAFAHRVLAERRRGGSFTSQKEFCLRLHPQPKELETLIRAGSLDGLADGWTRPERMRAAALWKKYRSAHAKKEAVTLFGTESSVSDRCWRPPPPAPEYDRRTQLLQEWETLGFLVSAHPLSLYAEAIREAGVVPARDLDAYLGRRVRLVGWQVTQKSVRTKDGQAMMFLSFEDTSALWEGVLWPRQWKRLAPWTLTRGPYLVEGVPREEHGVITVEVKEITRNRITDRNHPVKGNHRTRLSSLGSLPPIESADDAESGGAPGGEEREH